MSLFIAALTASREPAVLKASLPFLSLSSMSYEKVGMTKGSGQCLKREVDGGHAEDAEVPMAVSEQLSSHENGGRGHIGLFLYYYLQPWSLCW